MNENIPEQALFSELSVLIEQARGTIVSQSNAALTMLFWKIGKRVNEAVLQKYCIHAISISK
jgi:hypothetical protein